MLQAYYLFTSKAKYEFNPLKGIDSRCKKILATWKKIESKNMFRYINGEILNEIDRRVLL